MIVQMSRPSALAEKLIFFLFQLKAPDTFGN